MPVVLSCQNLLECLALIQSTWNKIQQTKYNLVTQWEGMQQEMINKLERHLWTDTMRAHEVYVLHWLHNLGYQTISVDHGIIKDHSLMASKQELPPTAKLATKEAIKLYTGLWSNRMHLKEIFNAYGNKVVMLFPERTENSWMLLGKLQQDLMDLHQDPEIGDWDFGILINVHRFPKNDDDQEDWKLGLHFSQQDMLPSCRC